MDLFYYKDFLVKERRVEKKRCFISWELSNWNEYSVYVGGCGIDGKCTQSTQWCKSSVTKIWRNKEDFGEILIFCFL